MAANDQQNPVRSPTPNLQLHVLKFVGGTAAVTKVYGENLTITYVSTGVVDVTLPEQYGTFEGVSGYCFSATTVTAVKAHKLAHGTINTTTRKVRLNIDVSGTLTDLGAAEWVTLTLACKANP